MTATHEPTPHPLHDVPGIIYRPITRRARIAGTGLAVRELINGYRSVGYDWQRLERAFDGLTSDQLQAAVPFANRNSTFVAADIAENDAIRSRRLPRSTR